jgi:hypothetical protein
VLFWAWTIFIFLFLSLCSKLSTDTKVWAGYNAWIPTETLISYIVCWRFVVFFSPVVLDVS